MLKAIPRVQTDDRQINQLQQNFISAINQLMDTSILSGVLLTNVALVSGDNSVNHKLGKTLTGWIVVRKRAAADIYDKQGTNATPTQTLALNTSADVMVDLYVF